MERYINFIRTFLPDTLSDSPTLLSQSRLNHLILTFISHLHPTDPKFLRNQRYAKHGTEKAVREFRAGARQTA
jgi:hypothetical protein